MGLPMGGGGGEGRGREEKGDARVTKTLLMAGSVEVAL